MSSILPRVTDTNGLDCIQRIVDYGLEAGTLDHIKRKHGLEYKPHSMRAKVTEEAQHIIDVVTTYVEGLTDLQSHITDNNAAVVAAANKHIAALRAEHPAAKDIEGTAEVASLLSMLSLDKVESHQLIPALRQYLAIRQPTAHEAFTHLGNFLAHAVRTSTSLFMAHLHPTLQRPGVPYASHPVLRSMPGYSHEGHQRELYMQSLANKAIGQPNPARGGTHAAPHVPQDVAHNVHPERALQSPHLLRNPSMGSGNPRTDNLDKASASKRESPRLPRHGKLKARLGSVVKNRGGLTARYRNGDRDLSQLCSIYHMGLRCPYGKGSRCRVNGKSYSHVCLCGHRHPLIECGKVFANDAFGHERKRGKGKGKGKKH